MATFLFQARCILQGVFMLISLSYLTNILFTGGARLGMENMFVWSTFVSLAISWIHDLYIYNILCQKQRTVCSWVSAAEATTWQLLHVKDLSILRIISKSYLIKSCREVYRSFCIRFIRFRSVQSKAWTGGTPGHHVDHVVLSLLFWVKDVKDVKGTTGVGSESQSQKLGPGGIRVMPLSHLSSHQSCGQRYQHAPAQSIWRNLWSDKMLPVKYDSENGGYMKIFRVPHVQSEVYCCPQVRFEVKQWNSDVLVLCPFRCSAS